MNNRKSNRKSNNNAIRVEKELVSNFVSEWDEFRVYRGNKMLASFYTPNEALAFVEGMKGGDFTLVKGNANKAAYVKGLQAA